MEETVDDPFCGYLTPNGIPQGYNPDGNSYFKSITKLTKGKPLWYCKCKKFRTGSFDDLREHIEGTDSEDGKN
jgi:hypothetical protein